MSLAWWWEGGVACLALEPVTGESVSVYGIDRVKMMSS